MRVRLPRGMLRLVFRDAEMGWGRGRGVEGVGVGVWTWTCVADGLAKSWFVCYLLISVRSGRGIAIELN